ncbi:hypothetical protein QEZ47_24005 [Aminobacter anthyllidis]|uniref:hypothetical protein n=1 Tax=Aminobacter anthyllidis TaxID=1035067 RepID=UPI0024570849|nr:hypothetical protein [Aminobacter anthyllidis]MDH4988522.1 hypothetical protein [Aminobacter anthyllidis]
MIKSALVAMTIVGCDCDAKLCEYIGETPAQWTSVADCEAAMKSRILREGNHAYPLVTGICRTTTFADPQLAAAPAVQPEVLPAAYAGTSEDSVLYRTANGYALVRSGLDRFADGTLAVAKRSSSWLAANIGF